MLKENSQPLKSPKQQSPKKKKGCGCGKKSKKNT